MQKYDELIKKIIKSLNIIDLKNAIIYDNKNIYINNILNDEFDESLDYNFNRKLTLKKTNKK